MKNNLNEKQDYRIIIAAIVCSFIVMVAGLATGLTCAVQKRHETNLTDNNMAQYLLEEAAYSLRNNMSALRLCSESEPAEYINRTALVHAVRAETALECHYDDWADSRDKEAFLNDISTILHSYEPLETIELSDKLYKYSSEFYESVVNGSAFKYDRDLVNEGGEAHPDKEITESDIQAAHELVKKALKAERTEYVGAWDGHIELYAESEHKTGYAIVCDDKIIEYSFMRADEGEETDKDVAAELALEAAHACGYDDLEVGWFDKIGKSVTVIMCRSYGGALARDDCATAIVLAGEVVSFSAGRCDVKHENIPEVKKTEREASLSAQGGGEGTLVVRTIDGKERVCYEYRYELEDGVHYVYVCAESGKQIQVV